MNPYLLYKDYITLSFQIVLILNLDYYKNVPSSFINYCSMNEGVQYESGTSSVQSRMCNTSKVDHQFWHNKIASNKWVITPTIISGENNW